jgi:hypothetical protein
VHSSGHPARSGDYQEDYHLDLTEIGVPCSGRGQGVSRPSLEYGDWMDWLRCLGIAVLLEAKVSMRNPDGHSPKWWRKHPEALPAITIISPSVPRDQLGRGDTWTILGVLLGVLFVVVLPPLLAKIPIFILVCSGLVWLTHKSYWTLSWSRSLRALVSLATVTICSALAVPQFVAQWRSGQHFVGQSRSDPKGAAMAITQGTVWEAPDLFHGIYFMRFNFTKKITPINIMADYAITNTKGVPLTIKSLSLEMFGKHGTWWPLTSLPTHHPIWSGDLSGQHPGVEVITLTEGFLMDKISNAELQPGQTVRGWLLCQIPADYLPPKGPSTAPLRLRVKDTAGDEVLQEIESLTQNDNTLYTAMGFVPDPNENLRDYELIVYGEN